MNAAGSIQVVDDDPSDDESSHTVIIDYESSTSESELYFDLTDNESTSGWLPNESTAVVDHVDKSNQADEDEDFYNAPACELCGCDESVMKCDCHLL